MEYQFKLLSSLEKIFFDMPENIEEHIQGSMFKNEIYSFQLAGWVRSQHDRGLLCKLEIESELAPYIEVKQIGYVPNLLPSIRVDDGDDYITKEPGLYPDPLYKVQGGVIELMSHQTRAFWISVDPKGNMIGSYPIVLKISDMDDNLLSELTFTLELIDRELPELDIYNTCWFYCDCITKMHNVEFMSVEFCKLVEKYMEVYTKFGHNTILTPVFTPPLNTGIGEERPTNQLVDVVVEGSEYKFGFVKLKKWIDMCLKYGIKYFEMCHLFTQWGVKHAPKVMATVDGEFKRIFGWETDSAGAEYKAFLEVFLPALTAFLKKENILEQCLFHISDEPKLEDEARYRGAKDILTQFIDEKKLIDALSDYQFYENGIVKQPVVCNTHIDSFLNHQAENLWVYYSMASRDGVANRFMSMPSYRNRILGYQLYKYEIVGFLHWGYNFWFTNKSEKLINPYMDTTAGGKYQGGDSFMIYPVDEEGDVVCSTRLYVFNESLQDMRALKLLEALTDRQTVLDLLQEVNGFAIYPRSNQYILELRERINQEIKRIK